MLVRVYSSMASLPDRYDTVFAAAEQDCVFHSRTWLETLIEHDFEPGTDVRVYGIETDDEAHTPIAVFAGYVVPRPVYRSRVIDGVTTAQSFRSSFVAGPRSPMEAWTALARKWRSEEIDRVQLELLLRTETQIRDIQRAIALGGMSADVELQDWNRYEDVSDTPFSKMAKKSTRRRQKKLEQTAKVRLELITDPADVGRAIAAYDQIYDKTWKEPEAAKPFVGAMITRAAERGWLRFALLWVDDVPVAAEVFFVNGGVASSFKTAYDLEYKEHSVGSIVLQYMLQNVMTSDGIREIDFGPGDEPYKKQWLSKTRELWRLTVYDPRRVKGALGLLRRKARKTAEGVAKAGRDQLRDAKKKLGDD